MLCVHTNSLNIKKSLSCCHFRIIFVVSRFMLNVKCSVICHSTILHIERILYSYSICTQYNNRNYFFDWMSHSLAIKRFILNNASKIAISLEWVNKRGGSKVGTSRILLNENEILLLWWSYQIEMKNFLNCTYINIT